MSNALSLTGLEMLSPEEKSRRIAAVANDIAASIIYIAKQAAVGNVSTEQITPIYNLIDKVNMVGRRHIKRLERELEEQDQQIEEMRGMLGERVVKQIEEIEGRHLEEMRRVTEGADSVVRELRASVERLESKLRELEGDGLGML
ncbi:hypothetical protein I7I51_02742 [Histoplasma capsulatum]|uniref:Uncharacterized protein n=1 Tax=Ajellomyces capsulatus TaxID=5037 RepID=A0A8A1MP86_AJECA|nr:predicted protein [Histoplasma mississippiense (nom. inval.)]EDN05003.1 predicted protein [Histoplasma mississippiense (nom. inval.)]QSS66554.1 hypothetical protein I7I51_02742 [Histoplasma capsulatum]